MILKLSAERQLDSGVVLGAERGLHAKRLTQNCLIHRGWRVSAMNN